MINILYSSSSDKYFKQMLLSLISLKNSTKERLNVINFNVSLKSFDKDSRILTDSEVDFFNKVLKSTNKESSFKNIDLSSLFEKELFFGPNLNCKYYSYFVTIRLLADLVEEVNGKFLYVDTDVLFINDVKELFDIDISTVELAGRRDKGRISNYINSGVMLLNMDLIRKTGLLKKARQLVTTKKYIAYIDMSAINKACKKRLILPKKFNDFTYNKNSVIHHVCATRLSKIPLTKKWWRRIKPDEENLMLKLYPEHKKIYEEFNDYKKITPLF
ncbi:MAG: hypothetical protein E7342_01125 [Clostridiales bacterium]|nr:hypothetical protein [Clostridiales bacterium]